MVIHPQKTIRTDERGIALLLALLLMAALIAAGIGASSIIIGEFRTVASTDQGIKAFYTADIGIERGLFTIYNNRLAGTILGAASNPAAGTTYRQILDNLPSLPALVSGATVDLARTRITRDPNQDTKIINLRKNQTAQIDLFDPNIEIGTGARGGAARTITLSSSSLSTSAVELQWIFILEGTAAQLITTGNIPQNATVRVVKTANPGDSVAIDLFDGTDKSLTNIIPNPPPGITDFPTDKTFSNIAGWIVRIKALEGNVSNLKVTACKAAESPCLPANVYQLPGDILLKSLGQYRSARFLLGAAVPWRLPVLGLFDFVIFSESSLDKPG